MTTTVQDGSITIITPSFTTSTNLGPLTTATSLPSECLANLYDMQTTGLGLPWTYQTQGCALSTCCPSGFAYTTPWAWMTSYYSPGVCPQQYRSCPPPGPGTVTPEPGETLAFCCPTNYNCPDPSSGGIYGFCGSALSTSTSVTVFDNVFEQNVISTRIWTLPTELAYSWQIAYPIQVRWKSGDFDPAKKTSTDASSESTSSPKASDTSHSSSGGGDGLSKGAIAGIVVGVVVFLLLVTALVGSLLFIARMRRRQTQQQPPGNQLPPASWQGGGGVLPPHQGMAIGAEYKFPAAQETQQIDGRAVIPPEPGSETNRAYAPGELDGRGHHPELDGRGYYPELNGVRG